MVRNRMLGCVLLGTMLCLTAHAADIRIGISGIPWQTPLSSAGNLEETSREGDVAFFVRPGENHTINHIRLGPVNYGFYLDRFYAAFSAVASDRDFQALKGYLSAAFGEPETRLQDTETVYSWVHQNVNVTLTQAGAAGTESYWLAYHYASAAGEPNPKRMRERFENHYRSRNAGGSDGGGDGGGSGRGGGRGEDRDEGDQGQNQDDDDQGENQDGDHQGGDRRGDGGNKR